ncbi:MAG: hypothetical protein CL675_10260 [Bdellovibrionaceae bacterium]|nr:hypothetical protein [Pseudobdellovibrionaceae bacterium]
MQDYGFYRQHLEGVSRSFAFCIDELDGEFRRWVASSYLICRVLDTIEDANWSDVSNQLKAFTDFEALLFGENLDIQTWSKLFPADLPEAEKALLDDAGPLFKDFSQFSAGSVEAIRPLVRSMHRGMQDFVKASYPRGIRLSTTREVNEYCFFVAGVVGEILTNLVSVRSDNNLQLDLEQAYHFGLFLQKVNLLKDQSKDEIEGRFFIPDRQEVFDSLNVNAVQAFAYIRSIPDSMKDFRLFCSWSYFLGMASLLLFQHGPSAPNKLDRAETESLISELRDRNENVEQLEDAYRFAMEQIGFSLQPNMDLSMAGNLGMSDIFDYAYRGRLDKDQIRDLVNQGTFKNLKKSPEAVSRPRASGPMMES